MAEKNIAFGKRLEQIILKANFTNNKVAELIDASPAAIGNYIKGRYPEAPILLKIAKLFNTTVDYLLTGSRALNPELEALGSRLKEIREDLLPVKLSPSEMSEKLEITVSEYLDYEDGVKEINDDLLKKYINLFNINPDWIKHGDTENKKRNKYILIREGDVMEDLVEFLYYRDFFDPFKRFSKNLKAIVLMIDEKDMAGTRGIILQENEKYHIFNHEGFIGKGLQRHDQYSIYMKHAICILDNEKIPRTHYRVTEGNFYNTFAGYQSPKLTISGLDGKTTFRKNEEVQEEYKEALIRKDSIIRQLKEADKEKKERTKDMIKHHIKEVRSIQDIETNPHLANLIGKVKKIYEEGTEDQRITIESLLQSFTQSIETGKRILKKDIS